MERQSLCCCLQGFTDAETFDPDRFSEARKEDIVHGRNFLTFGFGPHYCVGREYAINHLVRRQSRAACRPPRGLLTARNDPSRKPRLSAKHRIVPVAPCSCHSRRNLLTLT